MIITARRATLFEVPVLVFVVVKQQQHHVQHHVRTAVARGLICATSQKHITSSVFPAADIRAERSNK